MIKALTQKAKKSEYQKRYRAAHKDKCREIRRRWYARHREKCLEDQRRSWPTRPQKYKETAKLYQIAHKKEHRESCNRWNASHKEERKESERRRVAARPEKERERHRRWIRSHPEEARILNARRRALKKNAAGAGYTTAQHLKWRWEMWGSRCYICGNKATATDHVIPISKSGAHYPSNLRPICKYCNSKKHVKKLNVFLGNSKE